MEIEGNQDVAQEGAAEERMTTAPSTPVVTQCPYPHCRSKEINKLAKRAGKQLLQCGKCLNEFQIPLTPEELAATAPHLAHLPEELRTDQEEERAGAGRPKRTRKETGQKAKEKTVANGNCYCGRAEGHSGKHRGKGAPASPKAKSAKPKTSTSGNGSEKPDAVNVALEALRAKRAELVAAVPEIQRIDKAIAALEGVSTEIPS